MLLPFLHYLLSSLFTITIYYHYLLSLFTMIIYHHYCVITFIDDDDDDDDDDGDADTDFISFGQMKSEFTTLWICSCTALISTQDLVVQE